MSNADELRVEAENDMAELVRRSNSTQQGDTATRLWNDTEAEIERNDSTNTTVNPTAGSDSDIDLFSLLPQASDNVFDEIPVNDLTYQYEHDVPVPHGRLPELFLYKYRTFEGAFAYQPCGKNIDLSGLFKCLHPLDRKGDPLFMAAREWSCIYQGLNNLPKEIRWVLATIYNFANEALRPENDENTLWGMRPWLLHWYGVADRLFQFFGVPATTPDPDWFMTPTVVEVLGLKGDTQHNHTLIDQCETQLSDCYAASDFPAALDDSAQSVASEHDPTPMIVLAEASNEELEPLVFIPTVRAWFNDGPELMGFVKQNYILFDSASGGRVPFKMRLVASQHWQHTLSHIPGSYPTLAESVAADATSEAIEFMLHGAPDETDDWLASSASYCDIL